MKRHLKRFKDCLSDLQDNLGALNDICVHQKLATTLVSGRKPRRRPARDFAVGVISGREQSEIQPLLKAAGTDYIVPGSLMFKEDPKQMRQWLAKL